MDNKNYAGFWLRWLAQGVDIFIWALNFFVALFLFSLFGTTDLKTFLPGLLWFLLYTIFTWPLIKFFVHPWLISKFGGGLGKLACGLEVINQNGSRLTYKNALFREYIAKIASNALLGLGYYWIFRNPQRQGWHDSLAGTYVLKKYQGILAGIMMLILLLTAIGVLSFKSYENFKNAQTLQFDIVTLITQIQQDQI
ncbi:RDD family protein [Patescibacteria group bacterium]|nr:RDD family protein [Patescibacteria group bacterium]MBU1970659.1 RDD family protein [Patescibacteria group bacterium]